MRSESRSSRGFTLIELLIVVAIIGILAAIAIPNLLTAIQRAKQKRTMADMRALSMAWEARATDMSQYTAAGAEPVPAGDEVDIEDDMFLDYDEVQGLLAPTYLKSPPRSDGWNRDYVFAATQDEYGILSTGKDGKMEGNYVAGTQTSNFECDIVFMNGSFIQWPEGLQSNTSGGGTPSETDSTKPPKNVS